MWSRLIPRSSPDQADWIVLGLGNPGAEYALTRHNVGFRVVDLLASRHRLRPSRRRDHALYAVGQIAQVSVVLAKPMTYMNRSGEAARALLQRFQLAPSQLIVVVDDVALPLGKLRIRPAGSDGGHNGLASIIQSIGSEAFPRVRVGIGSAPPGQMVEYVLSPFLPTELPAVEEAIQRAADAVEAILSEGITAAMNRFNTPRNVPPTSPSS